MAEIVSLKTARPKCGCPLCGKPENHDSRPFCSKRCADIELGKWLNEDYRIASREEAGPDGEPFYGQ